MDNAEYELNIRTEIRRAGNYSGERLSIDETVQLQAGSFLEVAAVLGRFHELSERIKAEAHKLEARANSEVTFDIPVEIEDGQAPSRPLAEALAELLEEVLQCTRPLPREPSLEQRDEWAERFRILDPRG